MSETPKPKQGKSDRRALSAAARVYAVQALFQMEAADQAADLEVRE